MSKNHMAEVAALLGVELGEVFHLDFRLERYECYFRLTEKDFESSIDGTKWSTASSFTLKCILSGMATIVKKWKPRLNEVYYIPFIPCIRPASQEHCWKNTKDERKYYDMGLVCKTGEEAVELARRMLAVAKEGKNNG